jgi:hypothetical protein
VGSGQKRKKKNHRRPQSSKTRRLKAPRLLLLCDHDVERRIREHVSRLPGFSTQSVTVLGLSERVKDWGAIKDKANELKAIILTRDKDFLNQVNFQICTHPGVIRIAPPTSPEYWNRRLTIFLTKHYRVCKHAIVELRGESAFVQSEISGRVEEIKYLDDSG